MKTLTTANVELETNRGNLLLAQLAVHERNAIHRGAEAVQLAAGEILLRSHTHSEQVFFPISCVASVVRTLRDGVSVELALIGCEGMVGLDVFMEAKTQLDDVIVRQPGWAYQMPAEALRNQFRRNGGLQRCLLRFTDAMFAQIAQTSVCSRFHEPDARLARWLLMMQERSGLKEIPATSDALVSLLAVPWGSVGPVVSRLVTARAITSKSEVIRIVDRERLEMCACECFETLRQIYDRTLEM